MGRTAVCVIASACSFEGETLPSNWILADVHLTEGPTPPDEIATYWHADGVLVMFPISSGRYRIIADAGDTKAGGRPGDPTLQDTLENLLALCRPDARVMMVGPTVGLYPDAFFRRGVDVLGGVRVTAPDAFLDVLAEGGSGYHFFGRSAEKVVLVRNAMALASRAADFCRGRVRSTRRQPTAGPFRQHRLPPATSAA